MKHTLKPFHVLSQGEKFRAHVARILYFAQTHDKIERIYVIEEFTSVLDRENAKSLATGVSAFIEKYKLR